MLALVDHIILAIAWYLVAGETEPSYSDPNAILF